MNAEELLVHDGRERKGTERCHASVIDSLGVLALALIPQSDSCEMRLKASTYIRA